VVSLKRQRFRWGRKLALPHLVMSPGQKCYIHIPSRPALAPAFNPAKTLFLALAPSRQAV